jgi:hypothetical protein
VSDGKKKRPPMAFTTRGLMHSRRTVDLGIPRRVASPQSPTPFHQARSDYLRLNDAASRHRTPELCLRKSSYVDFQRKSQHESSNTLLRRAMEQGASVTRMKTTKILNQRRTVRDRIAEI